MKSLYRILVLTALLLLLGWIWPAWWWLLFVPFVFMAFQVRNSWVALGNSFVAGLVAWGLLVGVQYFTGSQLIASKIATLFGLPHSLLLALATLLLGGIIAGLSGLTGASLRTLLVPKKENRYY